MKHVRKAAVVAAVAATAFVGMTGTSSASAVDGSTSSRVLGASGQATWTADPDLDLLDEVTLSVEDTAQDGHAVSVQLVTWSSSGAETFYTKHVNSGGYEHTGVWTAPASNSAGIAYVSLKVCRNAGDCLIGPKQPANHHSAV